MKPAALAGGESLVRGDIGALMSSSGPQYPPMRRRSRPEDAIQRAIFQHFAARSAPNVFAFHPANGGFRKRVEASILKGLGVKAGTPDVFAVRDGRAYALELKAADGRKTKAQREARAALDRAGAVVGIAFGLDQALGWLEGHGLLVGSTPKRPQAPRG